VRTVKRFAAWWGRLTFAARCLILTVASLIGLPIAWRAYAWWWDLWNGAGDFYSRLLPVR